MLKKHHNGNIFKGWIPVIILFVASVFVIAYGSIRDKAKNEKLQALASQYNSNEQKKSQKEEQLKQKILQQIPGIVCWGDSLTAGSGGDGTSYPSKLQELVKQNIYEIPVINMGVGGEDTNTILGRAGVVPFVTNAFTIPSDLSRVNISLQSSNGRGVFPLRQNGINKGDGGVNPVTINGVEGTISIEQESPTSKEFKYYFKRSSRGKTTFIPDGTPIVTKATNLYNNYINIIFMGQNGGWTGPDDLISQQKLLINKLGKNKDKYLILGLTSGTREDRASLEQAMVNEYGNKYINLREYISVKGMSDAKLKPTKEDIEAMNVGEVPKSLIYEGVHFNSTGYTLIGNAVYKRLVELGYFNSIKGYVQELNKLNSDSQ